LWRKFDEFSAGTDFFQWAARIAYYKVLSFHKQRKRMPMAVSEEFVEAVATDTAARADLLEDRRRALVDCIAKLKERDRDLLHRRYTPGITMKQVAEQLGRPAKSVYAALARIRHALLECVERKLAAEGTL
jgi:RNA polymerase sigma-70 factor (ECF subfamily)